MNNFEKIVDKLKIIVIKLQLFILKKIRNYFEQKNYIKNGIKKQKSHYNWWK